MRSNLYWDGFADITVRKLVRPEPGDPFLIIADPTNDLNLAQACLAAGIRAGADTQLIIKSWYAEGTASKPGPILSDAIRSSKLVLAFCGGIVRAPAMIEARSKGTRLLSTVVEGIEDYVVRALLHVDIEAMNRNAGRIAKFWEETKHCRVTSPQGTDVAFDLSPRPSIIGDGAVRIHGDIIPGESKHANTSHSNTVEDKSDTICRGYIRHGSKHDNGGEDRYSDYKDGPDAGLIAHCNA